MSNTRREVKSIAVSKKPDPPPKIDLPFSIMPPSEKHHLTPPPPPPPPPAPPKKNVEMHLPFL